MDRPAMVKTSLNGKWMENSSSFLKTEEPNNPNSAAEDTEISIFDAQKYFNEPNHTTKRVSVSLSPLPNNNNNNNNNVERCDLSPLPRLSSVSSNDGYGGGGGGRNYRTRSFHATPTASSEASWNSQTGLLSNQPGSMAVSLRNPPPIDEKKRSSSNSQTPKWFLLRKCPCSGRKSVRVEENPSPRTQSVASVPISKPNYQKQQNPIAESITSKCSSSSISISSSHEYLVQRQPKIENTFHQRVVAPTNGFSFPILNQSPSTQQVKLILKGNSGSNLEDPPRESLEVFQPPTEEPNNRRGFGFNPTTSPISRLNTAGADDDVASDASSDLFEIETFSTQTSSYPMYHRRDSLEEAQTFNARRLAAVAVGGGGGGMYGRRSLDEPATPSIAPTECYEPSEASIDWSVTTAEGFDRTNYSVAASEYEDVAPTFRRDSLAGDEGKRRSSGGGGGGGGMLMMSCRHEKAVSVGPHPQPVGQRWGPQMMNTSATSTAGGRHVGAGKPNGFHNKPPLGSSHSARLSLAFATT